MRASPALLDLAHNATRDMIAGQQLRRTPRIFAPLTVETAFLFVIGGLSAIIFWNRTEHKTAALFVCQNPAFATHAFRHPNSHESPPPSHSGRNKSDELH